MPRLGKNNLVPLSRGKALLTSDMHLAFAVWNALIRVVAYTLTHITFGSGQVNPRIEALAFYSLGFYSQARRRANSGYMQVTYLCCYAPIDRVIVDRKIVMKYSTEDFYKLGE